VSDSYAVFFVIAAVFAAAGAIKGIRAMSAGEPYRFSWWEGLMFRGKMLTRNSTQMKTGLSIVVVIGCLLCVAGIRTPGIELGMGGLCIMIISDIAGRKDAT